MFIDKGSDADGTVSWYRSLSEAKEEMPGGLRKEPRNAWQQTFKKQN